MAVSSNATYLANLVDPEVIGNLIEKKLTNAIKFAPLADVDTTLVGQPGSTIKLPSWAYIGKAVTTAEGQSITINQLTASTADVTIHKVGNGVELTDESVLSGYGDPVGEATNQLALSIADALDDEILGVLAYTKTGETDKTPQALQQAKAGSAIAVDDIHDALVLFGEDIDGDKVLLVTPATYKVLRKSSSWLPASEMTAGIIIKGAVGEVAGCQVVVTNRISGEVAYIVKPGALGIYLKRDTMIETDRDIVSKSTVITLDKHYACYLKDASKAIKIS